MSSSYAASGVGAVWSAALPETATGGSGVAGSIGENQSLQGEGEDWVSVGLLATQEGPERTHWLSITTAFVKAPSGRPRRTLKRRRSDRSGQQPSSGRQEGERRGRTP